MFKVANRIKESSLTTGTGSVVLNGAINGFQTFLNGIGDGNSTFYAIENESQWEVGVGTYTQSTNSLSRDVIYESSNSGNKISLTRLSTVFCTYPADRAIYQNDQGKVSIGRDVPSYQLDVLGSGRFDTIVFSDGTTQSSSPDANLAILAQSGVAVSGWTRWYVDHQDHSATAVSGWTKYYVDSQDHSASAVSGLVSSSYLPYSGAIKNTDMGTFSLNASGITATDFTINNSAKFYGGIATSGGNLTWNDGEGTVDLTLRGGNTTAHLGENEFALCYNGAGITLNRGTVVYISGVQGQRPKINLSDYSSEITSSKTFGVVSEPISAGSEGFVCTFGIVENVNTNGITAGAPLWLGVSGAFTSTKAVPPKHLVFIGYSLKESASTGRIFVNPQNGHEIDELHDVLIQNKLDGDILRYDAASGIWKNSPFSVGSGLQVVNGTLSTGGSGNFTNVLINTGTITSQSTALDISQTWNNAATTFTGIKSNITDTASNSSSLLMDLQVGGSSQFQFTKNRQLYINSFQSGWNGATNYEGFLFNGGPQGGSVRHGLTARYGSASNGIALWALGVSYLGVANWGTWVNSQIGWSSADVSSTNPDTFLARDAANTLAQRNSTSAQTFRIYNTYTDASNYERGFMRWNSNVLEIGTEKGGSGTARNLTLLADGGVINFGVASINTSTGQYYPYSGNTSAWIGQGSNNLRLSASNTVTLYFNSSPALEFAYSGTSPNYVTSMYLGAGSGFATGSLVIRSWDWTNDSAVPGSVTIRGGNAYSSAVTYKTGASLYLSGGAGASTSGVGGSVYLDGGSGGTGVNGDVIVGNAFGNLVVKNGQLSFSGQSLTGSSATSLFDASTTWNTSGTPTAIKLNVTDTASNASSLLLDLQVGGASKFKVSKTGEFSDSSNYFKTAGGLCWNANSSLNVNIAVGSGGYVGFGNAANDIFNVGTHDIKLYRDGAAGILAQRNGASAQNFRLYGTYTNASNYNRLALTSTTGGAYVLQPENAGTSLNAGSLTINLSGDAAQKAQLENNGGGLNVRCGSAPFVHQFFHDAFMPAGANTGSVGHEGYSRPWQYIYANRYSAGGLSLTGSQATSLFDATATWNTSGTPTAIKLNVTDTASNAASLLMDLQVGGTSKFKVDKSGNLANSSNIFQFGGADVASPASQILRVASVLAGTSNVNGADWTLQGSLASGTGVSGKVVINNSFQGLSGNSTVTISIASPAVITWTNHLAVPGQAIQFSTTGQLPTGITAGTTYYVMTTGLAGNHNQFQISAVGPLGPAVNTSGTQSGTHTGTWVTSAQNQALPVVLVGPAGIVGSGTQTPAVEIRQFWQHTQGSGKGLRITCCDTGSSGGNLLECAYGTDPAFASTPGFWVDQANRTWCSSFIASQYVQAGTQGFYLRSDTQPYRWGGADDLHLYRDAADTLAQRRTTNAQTFRIYKTYTDASNYERLSLSSTTYSSAVYQTILCESAGTGAANINLVLGPKGTGAIVAQVPDGTATGGNARGQYAVDLQLSRTANTQVANATYAVISGGQNNIASGDCSGVHSGASCSATGPYASAFGYSSSSTNYYSLAAGHSCSASNFAAIALGFFQTASGSCSLAIGGESNTASAYASIGLGIYASANRQGVIAVGTGRFANAGDAQSVFVVLRKKTTDATSSTLLHDNSARLTIPSGKVFAFIAKISGIKSDGSAVAFYTRKGAIKNVGGTTTLVGNIETIGTDIEDNPATDVAITADDTNDALQINVTGITGETWRWVATVEGIEIGYGT